MRRGGRAEREVSKDKVTYPLDEEGDNLNSYGEEKREYIQCAAGSLDAGNFSQRRKEPGESQRRPRGSKNRRNREDESAFTRRCFPLSSAWN